MLNFGERLRMARERKGLTQMDVCKKINISNKSLSRYETNASSPNPDTINMLIRLYDVSTDFFLGISENMGYTFQKQSDALLQSNLTNNEKSLINSFKLLDLSQQEMFLLQISSVAEVNKKQKTSSVSTSKTNVG